MDIDNAHNDWATIDWEAPADDGGDFEEPPDLGYGPGRGPKRKRYEPETISHTLTWVICGVTVLFSGLFMLTISVSRAGGGIEMAYLLSAAIAVTFMGTFYVGGIWLGAKRGIPRSSVNRRAKPAAPDAPASTTPPQ
ncbi:MAG: hypothetical protein ACJAZO_005306 [Myxococcota bacterium]